jgi:predicted TIM-barrel fold metal-dependent hydrolase
VAAEYAQWWQLLRNFFVNFSHDERADIFGATATRTYNLKEGEQDESPSRALT